MGIAVHRDADFAVTRHGRGNIRVVRCLVNVCDDCVVCVVTLLISVPESCRKYAHTVASAWEGAALIVLACHQRLLHELLPRA